MLSDACRFQRASFDVHRESIRRLGATEALSVFATNRRTPLGVTNRRAYFWSDNATTKSAVGNWQRALKRLFELAKVPTGHAHRFRDTFAVEAPLAGISLERVSILLGHASLMVTEKHYSPWVAARQMQIED